MLSATMYIRLRYGWEKDEYMLEFSDGNFNTLSDVLHRARKRYRKSKLQLENEHGTVLKSSAVVENARCYKVKRQS